MSAQINVIGWFSPVAIECESDDPVIWLRQDNDRVSLNLTASQLDALEAAIAQARAHYAKEAA